jgi:hypothetical protein
MWAGRPGTFSPYNYIGKALANKLTNIKLCSPSEVLFFDQEDMGNGSRGLAATLERRAVSRETAACDFAEGETL